MKRVLCVLVLIVHAVLAQAELFDPIADVLQHPRCMNCHTLTDYPRQTDQRIRHIQRVVRGADGFGAPTLQCGTCHQESNVANGDVPGAPHWHLAPLSMGWEGLSRPELCATLKNKARNGGRSVEDLLKHMREDPLVLWGWNPGRDRTTPPLAHPEFVLALEAWATAGAPCPAP